MDPWAGNTSDPQSLHKYAYAHCDPGNGIDPSGEFTLGELQVSTLIQMQLRTMQMRTTVRVLKMGVALALNTYIQLRLRHILNPFQLELRELASSLSSVNPRASAQLLHFANLISVAISPYVIGLNILIPTLAAGIPGMAGGLATGVILSLRISSLLWLYYQAMAYAIDGVQYDNGTRFFWFHGDDPRFGAAAYKIFVPWNDDYDLAADIRPLRHFVDAWKASNYDRAHDEFIQFGLNLAKYGDFSGEYGTRIPGGGGVVRFITRSGQLQVSGTAQMQF